MPPKSAAKGATPAAAKKTSMKTAVAPKAAAKAAPKAAKAPAKSAAKAPAAKKAAAGKAVKAPKIALASGSSITQAALMQVVADQTGMTKAEVKRFVDTYLDIVKAHVLKGVKVKIGDLGTIMIRERKARMGRNPRTGEPVKIKASKKLAFRQSATMRGAVK